MGWLLRQIFEQTLQMRSFNTWRKLCCAGVHGRRGRSLVVGMESVALE